jgi:hypothetical protein
VLENQGAALATRGGESREQNRDCGETRAAREHAGKVAQRSSFDRESLS